MPITPSYDAVVIGAGPNGLAAAVTLAEAGKRVVVFEANETAGGGVRSLELTEPGFRHDFGAAVFPLGLGSPFFRRLPLERYGLRWIHPEVPLAHPLDGGDWCLLLPHPRSHQRGRWNGPQVHLQVSDTHRHPQRGLRLLGGDARDDLGGQEVRRDGNDRHRHENDNRRHYGGDAPPAAAGGSIGQQFVAALLSHDSYSWVQVNDPPEMASGTRRISASSTPQWALLCTSPVNPLNPEILSKPLITPPDPQNKNGRPLEETDRSSRPA